MSTPTASRNRRVRRLDGFAGMLAPCIVALLTFGTAGSAQQIRVDLDCCTPDDNESFGLIMSTEVPPSDVTLPDVDLKGTRFFVRGYRDAALEWADAHVMVLPDPAGDRVFVDANVNGDLSDDGPGEIFPSSDNEFTFHLFPRADKRYRIGIQIHRLPPPILRGDWPTEGIIDSAGNLAERMMDLYGKAPTTPQGFEGTKGTFFFDPYVNLSRGSAQIGDTTYAIGVLDYNHNGRFDDLRSGDVQGDQLLIDLNRNGTLVPNSDYGMFDLDAVFMVDGRKYKTVEVEPFGSYLVIEPTSDPLIPLLSIGQGSDDIATSIWDLELRTIDDKSFRLRDHQGSHILLNFWGEWCVPCLQEMPDLVEVRDRYAEDQLAVIGMLGSRDLEKAKIIIDEQKLDWPHVVLEEDMPGKFKVRSWPTNILLMPDGRTYKRTGEISDSLLISLD